MEERHKFVIFRLMLLLVSLTVTYFGFKFINSIYQQDGQYTWLMIISIFQWLTLLIIFVQLALKVESHPDLISEVRRLTHLSALQVEEIRKLREEISAKKKPARKRRR